MKILFTGGGTGGHVFPLVAIVRELRRIYPKTTQRAPLEFYYMGPNDGFSSVLLSQEDFIIKKIVSGKLRRYFSFQNVGYSVFSSRVSYSYGWSAILCKWFDRPIIDDTNHYFSNRTKCNFI